MSVPTPPKGPWSTSSSTVWGNAWNGNTLFTAVSFAQQVNKQTSGAIVNSITFYVWGDNVNEGNICGLVMGLTDNTTTTIGYTSGENYTAGTKFNLARGEKITNFTACIGPNNYNSLTQLGWCGVSLSTNTGRNLVNGTYTSDPSNGYSLVNVDVGSGFLAGFYGSYASPLGNFGQIINQFGVLFLARLANVDIGVTSYQPDPTNTNNGLNLVSLSTVKYHGPTKWDFSGSSLRAASTSYSSETTETFGGSASVSVSGEVFGIGASATGSLEWSSTAATGMSSEVTDEITLEWGISGFLPAGQTLVCTAVVSQGILHLTYDSTVTFTFADSTIAPVAVPETGSYSDVSFSSVDVSKVQSAINDDAKAVDSA